MRPVQLPWPVQPVAPKQTARSRLRSPHLQVKQEPCDIDERLLAIVEPASQSHDAVQDLVMDDEILEQYHSFLLGSGTADEQAYQTTEPLELLVGNDDTVEPIERCDRDPYEPL